MASFTIRFFLCNIVVAVILTLILIIVRVMKNHITPIFEYRINIVSLLTLLVPFAPSGLLKLDLSWLNIFSSISTAVSEASVSGVSTSETSGNINWLQDFSVSISESFSGILGYILFTLWLTGILVMLIATLYGVRNVLSIRSEMNKPCENLNSLLSSCKEDLAYGKSVLLFTSSRVKAPMTYGFFHPIIALPEGFEQKTNDEIKCVMLHELCHLKHHHILVNYAICISRIVYWFNPVVWLFLREFKTSIEVVCDNKVLKVLDSNLIVKYGEVIIAFASNRSFAFTPVNSISSSYKQVKKRIMSITQFGYESIFTKLKSSIILVVTASIVILSVPAMSVFANGNDIYSFKSSNVTYEDYTDEFGAYNGSFVLYDSNAGEYTIYNESESVTRLSPYSTYKIYDALIALEAGTISNNNSLLTWDGTEYAYETWNQDHNLNSAMESSVSWYFQSMDEQIGLKTLQDYYEQIGYGNCDLSGGVSEYWAGSTLKISLVEQVQLLEKFNNNEFGFEEENIQTVKDAICLEQSNGANLYGKTGTGANGDKSEGYFVGYVETDSNVYYFAVHIQGDDAKGSTAAETALSILEDMRVYSAH